MRQLFDKYLKEASIELSDRQIDDLLKFVKLLEKWNGTYNLTSVRKPEAMLSRHIMDSLVIGKFLQGFSFADVGSGPGIPGIPLAVMLPEKKFTLIDSRTKRSVFQRQALIELKLKNVNILNIRAEQYAGESFDGIVSRAFASLGDFLQICRPLCSEKTVFYAMKGEIRDEETRAVEGKMIAVHPLQVPGCDGARNLMIFRS